MADKKPQTFENHGRLIPGFHMVCFFCIVLNLIWAIAHVIRHFSIGALAYTLLSSGVLLLFLYTRQFATSNQDRIIRLEESLRISRLVPDVDPARLVLNQFIALRFATDAELPELCRRVLNEKLTDRKQIKRLIKTWRPDYQRV
jgi:hypothetical protein